jgi:hypothetical protein
MRIDSPRTDAPAPADRTRSGPTGSGGQTAPARGDDRVSLSADLRLVHAALRETAAVAPAVRPDAVAHGRALVESGAIDADPEGLAEALLNELIWTHDDPA